VNRNGPGEVAASRSPDHEGAVFMATKDSSPPAYPSSDQKPTMPDDLLEAHYSCLERLEDDLRHADLGIEERQELRDRVLRLRRRLSR
jgi:hypothetical protein